MVKELTPDDFVEFSPGQLLNKSCGVVMYFKPGCPHCQKVKNVWKEVASKVAFRDVMAFDCSMDPSYTEQLKTALPGLISTVPTFVFYNDGKPTRTFSGERTVAKFVQELLDECGQER